MAQAMALENQNNNFVQLVALFLAEILRSRRTSLKRVAEISQLVVENLPKLTSEALALSWLSGLEKDFEEVASLKQVLHFNYHASEINVYEKEIKDFASLLFENDMTRSVDFLKDAAETKATIQMMCIKYPDFCDYLFKKTDKGQLLPEFQKAE